MLFDIIHRCMVSCSRCQLPCACSSTATCRVTTEHATVAALTKQVLASFALDGVIYVELRTTPKVGPHGAWSCEVAWQA